MTAQRSDVIQYLGNTHRLYSEPMNVDLLQVMMSDEGHPMPPMSTADIRGYVAFWMIIDNRLFLSGFESFGTALCIPIASLPLHAAWFAGELRIQSGAVEEERINDFGYFPIYKQEIVLQVIDGVVISREVMDYQPPETFSFSQLDSLP